MASRCSALRNVSGKYGQLGCTAAREAASIPVDGEGGTGRVATTLPDARPNLFGLLCALPDEGIVELWLWMKTHSQHSDAVKRVYARAFEQPPGDEGCCLLARCYGERFFELRGIVERRETVTE